MSINGRNVLLIDMEDKFSNTPWYEARSTYGIIGNISKGKMIKKIKKQEKQ